MSEWVDVCALGDVPEPGAHRVMLGAEPVAVVRSEGQVYAIRDVCSHADVALSEGDVEGCFIECWLHGSRFDLRTGVPASLPALSAVPVYAVRVDGIGPQARIHVSLNAGGQSA
ncbi:MAG: non-heme iron oxygenase ferredoxin subunit [Actinobacteria bacterium]|nr:non-heme iron oxygenase ferredoxin subunit [Actinomycetota bacterium]